MKFNLFFGDDTDRCFLWSSLKVHCIATFITKSSRTPALSTKTAVKFSSPNLYWKSLTSIALLISLRWVVSHIAKDIFLFIAFFFLLLETSSTHAICFRFGGWLLGLEKLFMYTESGSIESRKANIDESLCIPDRWYGEKMSLIISLIPPNFVTKEAANMCERERLRAR